MIGASDGLGKFQSTLPVRGGTDVVVWSARHPDISIHPPRAGRDIGGRFYCEIALEFQSTLPVRGGTVTDELIQQ